MSRQVIVANRYAKALFDLAAAGGVISQIEQQLKLIVNGLEGNKELVKFLDLPTISVEKKIDVLKASFGTDVSELVYNTLRLMITRNRQAVIGNLFDSYVKIASEVTGEAHAIVYTAKALSDKELADVATQFEQVTGKKIVAEQRVKAELLGGVQVRIGDRLYDGSLSGKLARLEKSLYSNAL
jgi:F-type H+-transporting ATPase subunit delta